MVAIGYIITFLWVFAVMGIAQAAKGLCKAPGEASRKIVHVLVAFAWIPMYICFGSSWHLLVPPLCFVVLNYISLKRNVFSMMERENADKKSYGTVFYAVSMTIMAAFSVYRPDFLPCYGIGLFCLAFGDGFAPLMGSIKRGNSSFMGGSRTIFGSVTVFVLSLVVAIAMTAIFDLPLKWYACVLVALCGAVMEIAGTGGYDNLTLPLGTSAVAFLFLSM